MSTRRQVNKQTNKKGHAETERQTDGQTGGGVEVAQVVFYPGTFLRRDRWVANEGDEEGGRRGRRGRV